VFALAQQETHALHSKDEKTHGKPFAVHFSLDAQQMAVFCTVKALCCAPSSRTHEKELLPCVTGGAPQNKGTHGAGGRNDVGVRLPAPVSKTHGNDGNFAVHHPLKRTAK
jgi:hypothetical protein